MPGYTPDDYKADYEYLLGISLGYGKEQPILCPFHDDHHPSLYINIYKGKWYCYGCCRGGDVELMAKKLGADMSPLRTVEPGYDTIPAPKAKRKRRRKPENTKKKEAEKQQEAAKSSNFSLEVYCKEKALSREMLEEKFHMSDGKNCIIIPYLDHDGNLLYNKYRAAGKKIWSDKEVELKPYGLWLLAKVKNVEKKSLWIVEGESDTQTLWQVGIPAIGLPGASTPNRSFFPPELFKFKHLFVHFEGDEGGKEFITRIYQVLNDFYPDYLYKVYVVTCSDLGHKDLNDVWRINPEKDFFLYKKIQLLRSVKIHLTVAYQQIVGRKKWFDNPSRAVALSLFYGANVVYKNNRLFEWKEETKGYELVDKKEWTIWYMVSNSLTTRHQRKEVIEYLDAFIKNKPAPKDLDVKYINLKNVSIDYKTLKQLDVGKEHFVTNRVPFDFKEPAPGDGALIEKCFSDWVAKPEYLYEIVGYSMLRHYPASKWFILFGRGRNGKSTFLSILKTLLCGLNNEVNNVSSISLRQMTEDRFAKAELANKLVNLVGEMDYDTLSRTKDIKDLTGGETITAEFKFQQMFKFTNYAKLIFATNRVPTTTDTTQGFFRRVIVVPFKEIEEKDIDPLLLEKFKQEDYEFLLYKSVMALHKLYKHGFQFQIERDLDTAELYRKVSNPVQMFIDTHCTVTYNDSDFILAAEFTRKIKEWFTSTRQATMTVPKIYEEMSELGFPRRRARDHTGNRMTVFRGITWTEKQFRASMAEDDEYEDEYEPLY